LQLAWGVIALVGRTHLIMGVRQWLNEHRGFTTGLVGAAVAIAVGLIVMQVLASRRTITTKLPDAYFTIDDGKTFFTANTTNIPPFDYQGKPAVRAYVFQCTGGKPFVGYVERYLPDARKAILENRATPATQIKGREVKKPGDTKWVRSDDFAGVVKVTEISCPDGKSVPEPIEPP
jgi:hypothetical protein